MYAHTYVCVNGMDLAGQFLEQYFPPLLFFRHQRRRNICPQRIHGCVSPGTHRPRTTDHKRRRVVVVAVEVVVVVVR